jgi:hypothetical protein
MKQCHKCLDECEIRAVVTAGASEHFGNISQDTEKTEVSTCCGADVSEVDYIECDLGKETCSGCGHDRLIVAYDEEGCYCRDCMDGR